MSRYDIMINYDNYINENKDENSFITDIETEEYIKVAGAVESLVKYGDKVSLKNINILTELPIKDLEFFMDFILSVEEAAINKYSV